MVKFNQIICKNYHSDKCPEDCDPEVCENFELDEEFKELIELGRD